MFYIVALGNPGEKYTMTRHNIGWLVLDAVRANTKAGAVSMSKVFKGRTGSGLIANEPVQYLYPETFMNQSGQAVRAFLPVAEINKLVVLHDDIALPLGELRVSFGRGSGGQNGVQSIINTIGSKDFVRIRLGIAPRSFWTGKVKRPVGSKLPAFVLGRLTKGEQEQITMVARKTQLVLEKIIEAGYLEAMNTYN